MCMYTVALTEVLQLACLVFSEANLVLSPSLLGQPTQVSFQHCGWHLVSVAADWDWQRGRAG